MTPPRLTIETRVDRVIREAMIRAAAALLEDGYAEHEISAALDLSAASLAESRTTLITRARTAIEAIVEPAVQGYADRIGAHVGQAAHLADVRARCLDKVTAWVFQPEAS